ncbi:ubiquitin-protein ligase peroxin 10 [Saccharomyces paradoxus]|uniref:RING-type E3 ubiquitin transferase n=1 Tax=Saccharomyces paradoxus TaxID=27291 RepID=A0A8B8UP03_SACPA|nr:Pex10 [Saccharomyces paradoxus]QHS72462.1 Pex10 [Saccharomyces paradoxus]
MKNDNKLQKESLKRLSRLRYPFADAPSIVQAHQKDEQIQTLLILKVTELCKLIKNQLFVNSYPRELSIFAKLLYLLFTTGRRGRTLGEEYVDLIYTNKKGTQLVGRLKMVSFVFAYSLCPYFITKLYKKIMKSKKESETESVTGFCKSLLDFILDLYMTLFYFKGTFYSIFKRIFGMRYVFKHIMSKNETKFRKEGSKKYKVLGYILLAQNTMKWYPVLTSTLGSWINEKKSNNNSIIRSSLDLRERSDRYSIEGIPSESQLAHINLSDKYQLPYIPESSRKCILCLMDMTDPSCAPCGHLFCWNCLMSWCKERPECPLCRQHCQSQEILALRQ